MSTTVENTRGILLRGDDLLAAREVIRNAITNLACSIGDGCDGLDDYIELREMARVLLAVGLVGHPILAEAPPTPGKLVLPNGGFLDEPLIKSLAEIAEREILLADDAVANHWDGDDDYDPAAPSVADGQATERRRGDVARQVLAALGAKS